MSTRQIEPPAQAGRCPERAPFYRVARFRRLAESMAAIAAGTDARAAGGEPA